MFRFEMFDATVFFRLVQFEKRRENAKMKSFTEPSRREQIMLTNFHFCGMKTFTEIGLREKYQIKTRALRFSVYSVQCVFMEKPHTDWIGMD